MKVNYNSVFYASGWLMHDMRVNIIFSCCFDYWADAVHAILMISVFDFDN